MSANLTVPQVRRVLAQLLHNRLQQDNLDHLCHVENKITRRKESARFYHWKTLNRLPPKRIAMRR